MPAPARPRRRRQPARSARACFWCSEADASVTTLQRSRDHLPARADFLGEALLTVGPIPFDQAQGDAAPSAREDFFHFFLVFSLSSDL